MKAQAFFLSLFLSSIAVSPVLAATLTITSGGRTLSYKTEELLQRKDLVEITAEEDPAYPGPAPKYKAVRFTALFNGLKIQPEEVLQFRALDGFSAPVVRDRLLNDSEEKGSVAYVAVEDPAHPWPVIPGKKLSAGPFYLVWKNPEKSAIGPEEWPYQLASFDVKGTLRTVYPGIFPYEKGGQAEVNKGFALFQKHCFSCHTMNTCGASQVGPDLNVPMNPFEYMQEPALRKLIRDPRSVRKWPHLLMTGFDAKVLPESDMNALLAYLRHMKGKRRESCTRESAKEH